MKTITEQRKWNLTAGGSDPRNDVVPADICAGIENALMGSIKRVEQLEEEVRDQKLKQAALVSDAVLYEDRADRIKHLENIIIRAHMAFFSHSSGKKASAAMLRILDEEVRKEAKP